MPAASRAGDLRPSAATRRRALAAKPASSRTTTRSASYEIAFRKVPVSVTMGRLSASASRPATSRWFSTLAPSAARSISAASSVSGGTGTRSPVSSMSRIARIICAMPAKRCQTPISRRKRNEPSNNATVRPFGAVSDLPAQSTGEAGASQRHRGGQPRGARAGYDDVVGRELGGDGLLGHERSRRLRAGHPHIGRLAGCGKRANGLGLRPAGRRNNGRRRSSRARTHAFRCRCRAAARSADRSRPRSTRCRTGRCVAADRYRDPADARRRSCGRPGPSRMTFAGSPSPQPSSERVSGHRATS